MARRRRQRGRRGRGTTYYDANAGSWVAVVTVGSSDGRRIRRKARGRSEEDARAQLERLLQAHRAGVDPAKGTLGQYLAGWLRDVRPSVRPRTWESYDGHVRLHVSPLIGGVPLVRVRPADVRRLKEHLLATRSPKTTANVLTTLHAALAQAVRDRILPDNAADAVRKPRVEYEPVAPMTDADADAIVAACRGSAVENLVIVLLGSGLRLGEVLGLDWRDVDLEQGFVVVRRSKVRVRSVPVSDDAVEALRAQRASTRRYGPREPVFIGPNRSRVTGHHERMERGSARRMFQLRLERAGLDRISVHALRHGVATMLVGKGVHMRVIAEQLGQTTPSVTARYAHVAPAWQREAVRRLGRQREDAG